MTCLGHSPLTQTHKTRILQHKHGWHRQTPDSPAKTASDHTDSEVIMMMEVWSGWWPVMMGWCQWSPSSPGVVHHPDTDGVMTAVTTDTLRDTSHLPRDKMWRDLKTNNWTRLCEWVLLCRCCGDCYLWAQKNAVEILFYKGIQTNCSLPLAIWRPLSWCFCLPEILSQSKFHPSLASLPERPGLSERSPHNNVHTLYLPFVTSSRKNGGFIWKSAFE